MRTPCSPVPASEAYAGVSLLLERVVAERPQDDALVRIGRAVDASKRLADGVGSLQTEGDAADAIINELCFTAARYRRIWDTSH